MAGILYQLGSFQFNLQEGSPNTVDRQLAWRWPQQDRLARKPARQFLGPDLDALTLDGILYPGHTGKQKTIDDLKAIADEGKPLPFTDGLGRVYPRMVILTIRESREVLMDNGAARRIKFTITIAEYGEDGGPGASGFLNVPPGLDSYIGSITKSIAGLTPFQGAGSPFDLTTLTSGSGLAGFFDGALGAGFSPGQLGGVAQLVGGGANVPGALGALGLNALDSIQSAALGAVGVSAQGLLNAALQGQAPAAASIALGALQGAGQQILGDIGGAATSQLTSLVQQAGTAIPLLNVDPAVTQRLVPSLILD